MHAKHLLGLLVFVCSLGYALDEEAEPDLSGIWHSEVESAGLTAALEFEIVRDSETQVWNGRWEMLELTGWGPLQRVDVNGVSVDVVMQQNLRFSGILTLEKDALKGTLHLRDTDLPLTFVKVEQWATRMPARTNDRGQPMKSWSYAPPASLDDGWSVAPLEEEEIDDLHELFQNVIDGRYQGLDAVLIARGGQLVLEEYFHFGHPDEIHTLQSVTKSVSSMVFGMAYDEGLIGDLDQPVYEYFPDYADSVWVKEKHPITLKHTLTMSAALDWDEKSTLYTDSRNDTLRMNRSGDMYGYVLSRRRAPDQQPGDKFEYTSGLSILLGGVVQEATGHRIDHYAEKTLFERMGINRYYWSVNSDQVHTGGGLYLRARDLLKIGQLVLDQGRWNDEQVVSARWIKESTAFHLPRPDVGDEWGYGYQWWRTVLYFPRGSVPVIYGDGYGGQYLWVFPKLQMVMLVFHHNPRPGENRHTMGLNEVRSFIVPALVSDKLNGICIFKICF